MILTLDIGNSQIYGGIFDQDRLTLQFRKPSKDSYSSDELGLFIKNVLTFNKVNPDGIRQIALCSVVPDLLHSVRNCCLKYFGMEPFVLQSGVRTGLKICYHQPQEVGSDKIANAIGGTFLFPNTNLILADFGTATTLCAVSAQKEFLGGLIMPGLRISMETLEHNTAKLPKVEIIKPPQLIGRTTVENIQSGLFYGTYHMIEGLTKRLIRESFDKSEQPSLVIGTGEFGRLFEKEKLFDHFVPDLVLQGLYYALKMNH